MVIPASQLLVKPGAPWGPASASWGALTEIGGLGDGECEAVKPHPERRTKDVCIIYIVIS